MKQTSALLLLLSLGILLVTGQQPLASNAAAQKKLQGCNIAIVDGNVWRDGRVANPGVKTDCEMCLFDTDQTSEYGTSKFKALLVGQGATVTRFVNNQFDVSKLSDWCIVVLAGQQRVWTSSEIGQFKTYVDNGGGLLVWNDLSYNGHWNRGPCQNVSKDSDNQILSQFGMQIQGNNFGRLDFITDWRFKHYINGDKLNLKVGVQGANLIINNNPNGKILLGPGSYYSKWKTCNGANPSGWGAFVILEQGCGRLLVWPDDNYMLNGGTHLTTGIDQGDHRFVIQRSFEWLARRETGTTPSCVTTTTTTTSTTTAAPTTKISAIRLVNVANKATVATVTNGYSVNTKTVPSFTFVADVQPASGVNVFYVTFQINQGSKTVYTATDFNTPYSAANDNLATYPATGQYGQLSLAKGSYSLTVTAVNQSGQPIATGNVSFSVN